MTSTLSTFSPDWMMPPGETIVDLLEERKWTQAEFASRIEYTRKHVNLLIKGKAPITQETALKLERVLGSTVAFWLSREARYREALARQEDRESLKNDLGWLKRLPIKDMIKFHWISQFNDKREQVAECLRFFGVASVDAWEKKYERPIAAFRGSKLMNKHKGAIAAWLRQGERKASDILCQSFDKFKFKEVLNEIRTLTKEDNPTTVISKLVEICATAGVAVVVEPAPRGCPVSGATRWLGAEQALLMLSNRYQSNDQFWFSFFHEAGHLLLHGKRLFFIDVEGEFDGEQEEEANAFASDILIPSHIATTLVKLPCNEVAVRKLAKDLGIAPGIIVGRMQKEGWLPWTHLNALKTKMFKK